MVDIFALALPHALLMLALWRIVMRDDLDVEDQPGGDIGTAQSPPVRRDRVSRGVRVLD